MRNPTKPKVKPIAAHTDRELANAIAYAAKHHPHFYTLLHGIDAYMERRKRREEAERYRQHNEAMEQINPMGQD